MMKKRQSKKSTRIATIVIVVFLVLSFSLLIFATLSRNNPDMTLFGYRFYYVLTDSMEPDIKEGSFILVKETDFNELKVGDVISFVSRDPDIEGEINSHRIYSIDKNEKGVTELTTKGSNNPIPDEYKVYEDDIKGKVVYDSYTIGTFFEFLSDRRVSFCLTVLPIAVIVLINLVDLFVIINTPEKKEGDK